MISSESVGLLFRAKGDTADAKKAFSELQQSIHNDSEQIGQDIEGSTEAGGEGLTSLGDIAGKVGETFSAVAGIVGTATGIVVAFGAAAVVVGKQLYDLAEAAREYATEIDKFQKLTSLSTDAIQSLKVAAESTGDSLDTVTEVWESFSELIIEAARGEEEAVKKLTRNHIDAKTAINDLEGTFAKAMKTVNAAPEGFKQNAAAMDLFGDSGLDLIPIIRKMDGNLQGFTKSLKDQGVIIDSEGIRKAGLYGEKMEMLELRFAALKTQIGVELMPAFIDLGRVAGDFLTKNKDSIVAWGKAVSEWISKAIINVRLWGAVLRDVQAGSLLNMPNFTAMKALLDDEKRQRGDQTATEDVEAMLAERRLKNKLPLGSMVDPEEAAKKRKEALEKQLQLVLKYNELEIDAIKQKFDRIQNVTLEDLTALQVAVKDLMMKSLNESAKTVTGQDFEILRKQTENDINAWWESIEKQKREFQAKSNEAEIKANADFIKRLEDDAKQRLEIKKAETAADISELEVRRAKGDLLAEEMAQIRRDKAMDLLKFEQALNDELLASTKLTAEKRAELEQRNALIAIELRTEENKATAEHIELLKKEREALQELIDTNAEHLALYKEPAAGEEGGDSARNRNANLGGLFGSIDWQGQADVITGVGEMISNTFYQIAEAVGASVEAFVLFGGAGVSFQKFAAQLIASIAKMAAIQAIWNLAEGFAKLALAFFGHPMAGASATQHFIAAGVYGAIAGVAAIAGRGVAGNAFKGQTSGAYGSSTSSAQNAGEGGDVYSANRDKQIINLSRNMSQSVPEQQIVIRDRSGMFDEFFVVEVSRNGKVRDTIKKVLND